MASLMLSLLGTFQAEYDGRPLVHFRTRAVQALLVYLAFRPVAAAAEGLTPEELAEAEARGGTADLWQTAEQLLDEWAASEAKT